MAEVRYALGFLRSSLAPRLPRSLPTVLSDGTFPMNRSAIHSSAIRAAPSEGVVVRNSWARNLLTFLMVFGPGSIVMEADNDAGAVSTYIQAGAQYGTHLLAARPAIAHHLLHSGNGCTARDRHRQGHAAIIYRRFGKWWGLFFAGRPTAAELPHFGDRFRRHSSRSGTSEH